MTCRYPYLLFKWSSEHSAAVRGFLKIYNFDAISHIHSIAATIKSNATDGRKNFSSAD